MTSIYSMSILFYDLSLGRWSNFVFIGTSLFLVQWTVVGSMSWTTWLKFKMQSITIIILLWKYPILWILWELRFMNSWVNFYHFYISTFILVIIMLAYMFFLFALCVISNDIVCLCLRHCFKNNVELRDNPSFLIIRSSVVNF